MTEYLLYANCVLVTLLTCVVGIVMLSYDSKFKKINQRVSRLRDSLVMAHTSIDHLQSKISRLGTNKVDNDTERLKYIEDELERIGVYIDMLLVTSKETK